MRVKKLIEELKNCDPEALIVAGGKTVHFAEEIEWYWDGVYPDDKDKNGKFKYYTEGNKVRLNLWDHETWFEHNCLDYTKKDWSVPKWSDVEKKMDLDHYYIARDNKRYTAKMMDVWFDWLVSCKFKTHKMR